MGDGDSREGQNKSSGETQDKIWLQQGVNRKLCAASTGYLKETGWPKNWFLCFGRGKA